MNLKKIIKEIIFPRWCCGCNSYGTLLCEKCFSNLQFSNQEKIHTSYLDSIASLVSFEKISKALVHQLKYQSVIELGVVCARMMYLYGNFPETELVTSIPLHRYRSAQRGFNQAEVIAKELAKLLQLPYLTVLQRNIHTSNLASVSNTEDRKRIISGQFSLLQKNKQQFINKNILIVDDVWTTGATLEEATRILKLNNVKAVHAYTFAHGI
jgi:competence protein ComFC